MNLLKSLFGNDGTSLSAADAKTRIEQGSPLFILDVRQPEEFQGGHITGAKLIPLAELTNRLKELPKDKEILCVCASGSRSSAATRLLSNAGYKALNMRGGMTGWRLAGFPMKKGR
ncbi:MAG: rhodanese-like domain-containing protein [Anaerolineae bacterium]|nr:rhodanese-like domain-containing protein [Anaerolineae bacterium]